MSDAKNFNLDRYNVLMNLTKEHLASKLIETQDYAKAQLTRAQQLEARVREYDEAATALIEAWHVTEANVSTIFKNRLLKLKEVLKSK